MEIKCQYSGYLWSFGVQIRVYICEIESQHIPENVELKLIGAHLNGRTDGNVIGILLSNCNISKVPQGLTKIFPNIKYLKIHNSNLKSISKSDLVEYKNCKRIDFYGNQIDHLPGDLFEDFVNLEKISFENNKLSYVEPNILDGLEKLKYVNLNGGIKYGSFKSNIIVDNWSSSLNEVRNTILNKMIDNENKQILKDFIFGLQLKIETLKKIGKGQLQEFEQKYQNLEQEVIELKEENQNLQIDNLNLNERIEALNQEGQQLRNDKNELNQEIQELKNQKDQSEQKILHIQQINLDLTQRLADLLQEYESKILKEQEFSSDIKTFIQDETTKDFQIQIDDHAFPVHKFLLAARSPTLAELLKNNPEVENLNLVDISVETFEKILKFLYTDELPDDDGINFLHLFAAAGKLKIDKLMNFAAEKLLNNVNSENALELLNLSNKYEHEELLKAAFEEIKMNYSKMNLNEEMVYDGEKIEKLIKLLKKFEEMVKNDFLM